MVEKRIPKGIDYFEFLYQLRNENDRTIVIVLMAMINDLQGAFF